MDHLITANLRSRPTRTIISIFAVAMGVILMLVIDGITSGTLNDTVNRTIGVGADFILQPSDSGIIFALGSTAALPIKLAETVREIKGVGAVTPVLTNFSMKDFGMVFGIDLASYDQFPGALQIVEGRRSLSGDDVIVDQLYAKSHNIKPGQELIIAQHKFKVSGICRRGAAVREFVPLSTLQSLMDTTKVSMFFIKAAPGVDPKVLESELRKVFFGYHLYTANDAAQLLEGTKLPMLKEFSLAVKVISMLISFMVILLAMYTTIFERTREIGILKSLGASRGFVVNMVMRESVLICFLGVLLGTGIGQLIRKIITTLSPTLQVQMSLREIALTCVLGIVAGLLGALYPAYKAARMDPVKALSYE